MLIRVNIRLKFFFGIWVIIFAQFLQYILWTVIKLTILSRLLVVYSYECFVSFHYCPVPWCIVHFTYHLNRNFKTSLNQRGSTIVFISNLKMSHPTSHDQLEKASSSRNLSGQMAYNRIGQATTEPFVSWDCVRSDGLPNFYCDLLERTCNRYDTLDNDSEEQLLPPRDSILVFFQLLINIQFM